MILFPNCKINLGLHIVSKRSDGYHNLETVFYPLPFYDVLEAVQASNSGLPEKKETRSYSPLIPETVKYATPGLEFTLTGIPVEGNAEDNLAIKAWRLIKNRFPELPSVKMHLHKHIPSGAGLGGGSSDGSYVLRLLNEKFQLGLGAGQLEEFALSLGSDCPFFIDNKPCFATGQGEQLDPIALDLSSYLFVLICPRVHISTAWAFSQISPAQPSAPVKDIVLQHPPAQWKGLLENDFEAPVCKQYPLLAAIKRKLYEAGALYASMTGSGSGFYGIFHRDAKPAIEAGRDHEVFILNRQP